MWSWKKKQRSLSLLIRLLWGCYRLCVGLFQVKSSHQAPSGLLQLLSMPTQPWTDRSGFFYHSSASAPGQLCNIIGGEQIPTDGSEDFPLLHNWAKGSFRRSSTFMAFHATLIRESHLCPGSQSPHCILPRFQEEHSRPRGDLEAGATFPGTQQSCSLRPWGETRVCRGRGGQTPSRRSTTLPITFTLCQCITVIERAKYSTQDLENSCGAAC